MSEENLFPDKNENQDEIIKEKPEEKVNIITEGRETTDSVQIHSEPEAIVIEDEEYQEKCYSMKEGSILGGVFALSSLALGTGAFSIPIRCTQLGLVWYILFIFAVLVGIERMYAGCHFPSDVFTGAIIGIIISYILFVIYNKLFNKNH